MQKLSVFMFSVFFMIPHIAYSVDADKPPSSVLSSQDFKSLVNTMGKESQADLKDQLNNSLSKKMPVSSPDDSGASSTSGRSSTKATPDDSDNANHSQQGKKKPSNPGANTYTGFGTGTGTGAGTNTAPSTAPANSQKGGWNINY